MHMSHSDYIKAIIYVKEGQKDTRIFKIVILEQVAYLKKKMVAPSIDPNIVDSFCILLYIMMIIIIINKKGRNLQFMNRNFK